MALRVGDRAPDWTLVAAHSDQIVETSLQKLLDGRRALVLVTYALDFTAG